MMIVVMASLDLADAFATFLALLGPQKVLVAFAQVSRTLNVRAIRTLAGITALTAAGIGALFALTAPWLVDFFHISVAGLHLSAGLVFFIYAVGLVFGFHLDMAEPAATSHSGDAETDPSHPLSSGFRAMLVPFVISPLAIAAELEVSLSAHGWAGRWKVAGAFALVALVDAVSVLVLAPLLGRLHETVLEVMSRLLGLLLAAVAVELFLRGLAELGVLAGSR